MQPAPPIEASFRQRFCTHFGVPLADYHAVLLRHTLHPHARWLHRVVERIAPGWFTADRALVTEVSTATAHRDLHFSLEDYNLNPRNRRFARRVLRLCISPRRFERVCDDVWVASIGL